MIDLAWVQRRIASASAAELDSDSDRSRRAEALGTWAGMGITTIVAVPLVRLVLLLWGIHALTVAGGSAVLDLSRPLPQTPAGYGGCAPTMAIFMRA